jgi:phosphotransferase system  glucose/maltose/N-acetylglucosamine-specific IIC component
MSVEDVSKVVTYASNQSDRWLFIAVLVVLLMFAGMVIRWLVTQMREQRASHEAQQKESMEQFKQVVVVLHDATEVLRDVRAFMARNVKVAILILGLCFLAGCATTTLYGPTGKPIARLQGDMINAVYTGPGTTFRALSVTHSAATKAQGDAAARVMGSVGTAAIGVGTAVAGPGIIRAQ